MQCGKRRGGRGPHHCTARVSGVADVWGLGEEAVSCSGCSRLRMHSDIYVPCSARRHSCLRYPNPLFRIEGRGGGSRGRRYVNVREAPWGSTRRVRERPTYNLLIQFSATLGKLFDLSEMRIQQCAAGVGVYATQDDGRMLIHTP